MRSITNFFSILFSPIGIVFVIYIIIGIFTNTAPPHLPGGGGNLASEAHSWVQYAISVMFWPLSFWSPEFTTGKWTGP